jgi:hypothetical protein
MNPSILLALAQAVTLAADDAHIHKPLLVMHTMKAGGTALCRDACRRFYGSSDAPATRPRVNCRVDEKTATYRSYVAALGRDAVAAEDVAPAAAAAAMAAHRGLCGTIMVEPGYRLDATARSALDAPPGGAYATVLLFRDPVARFLSFAAMNQRKARTLTPKELRSLLRGEWRRAPRRYEVQLRNFLTRHLLPSADFGAAEPCTDARLLAALDRLGRYDVVLNLADRRDESYFLMEKVLGVAANRTRARGGDDVAAGDAAAYARARGYALSEDDLARLRAANRCDLEVAARANARMDGLLAEHGYAGKPR